MEGQASQCMLSHVFKFFNKGCPEYADELFLRVNQTINTSPSNLRRYQHYRKTNVGMNTISYLRPAIWNRLSNVLKESKELNTFKYRVKDHYIQQFHQRKNDQFIYH